MFQVVNLWNGTHAKSHTTITKDVRTYLEGSGTGTEMNTAVVKNKAISPKRRRVHAVTQLERVERAGCFDSVETGLLNACLKVGRCAAAPPAAAAVSLMMKSALTAQQRQQRPQLLGELRRLTVPRDFAQTHPPTTLQRCRGKCSLGDQVLMMGQASETSFATFWFWALSTCST